MLYDCSCTSVSDYGSEIWGYLPKEAINKIHLRAARSYLGLPKNVTKAGVATEVNWIEPIYRAQLRIVRQFLRVSKMSTSRLTKQIVDWNNRFFLQHKLPTWFSEVGHIFESHNMSAFFNLNHD